MIAINWGTSNFRAFKLDGTGAVEAERSSERGAALVSAGGFEDALMAEVGDWIAEGDCKVILSGMVGSRQGWKEAPYVRVPATFEEVAAGVIRVGAAGFDAWIVPGLMGADENGVPEVMRGEETEIFGCDGPLRDARLLCLPGTHTKWVRMEGARIASFTTSMTGDLFAAIREGTILRISARSEVTDDDAFLRGVARSRQAGNLAHHLFGVRTLVLTGEMRESAASSYLSGLLIGHEVKELAQPDEPVHLVGSEGLCSLYAKALGESGVGCTVEPAGAALRGLKRIAARLQW